MPYKTDEYLVKYFLILTLTFCAVSALSQKKENAYTYDVCLHQKMKPGKAYVLNEIITRREDKTPYIEGIICERHKKPIMTSTVTLSQSENDSVVRQIILDSTNIFSFDNLKPGKYNVSVSSNGYLTSIMTGISVDKFYALPFVFVPGRIDKFIMTTITSDKKLSEKKLNQRIKELEEELNR